MEQKNFTLSSLILACLCCGLFAAFISRCYIQNNEGAAIGTLRTLSSTQEGYKGQSLVDQDSDGIGEYGLLGELAGTANRRNSLNEINQRPAVNPTFCTPVLGPVGTNTYGEKSGYRFQIYLPGSSAKNPITDNGTLGFKNFKNLKAIDAQETHYRIYAWPIREGSGIRCFAVDQEGEVLAAPNRHRTPYEGDHLPSFDAAVSATPKREPLGNDGNTFIGIFGSGKVAFDQQIWKSAGGT